VILLLIPTCFCYRLVDTFAGPSFFDHFDFWTYADPTDGFVKFVDRNTAQNNGYIRSNATSVYMGVDHTNNAPNGRNSVRITSISSWKSGLFILILSHVPGGQCGSWPAFWTVGDNWPNNGEIDIIEGVNTNTVNQMTLHTSSGCVMNSGFRNMSGKSLSLDCDAFDNGNAGCGVQATNPGSYGRGFNALGGGAYVMELTANGVKIWFFARKDMPSDIASNTPNPNYWRIPDASFPFSSSCSVNHFGPQQIVFDMTFCGQWANAVYQFSGCPSTCENFVAYNPQAFADHYWEILSLKVYQ